MATYNVFTTSALADSWATRVNNHGIFPKTGNYRGSTAPIGKQKTERWVTIGTARETLDGRFAYPAISDAIGIPSEDRAAWINEANPNVSVEELTESDFVSVPE